MLHVLQVVDREYGHVVSSNVVQSTATDVHLHVHARAVATCVELANDMDWGQEGVLGIVGSAKDGEGRK